MNPRMHTNNNRSSEGSLDSASKIAYFDCFSGVSGDMVLGALIDAGLSLNILKKELGKLNLRGYTLESKRESRNSIWGTAIKVRYKEEKSHRFLKDIFLLIDRSKLDKDIKTKTKEIFTNLAKAEAKVHNKSIEEIHFHEVGAIDSIIDIVGSVIGIKSLGIKKIYSSPLHLGTGFVECSHGTFPVPSPATVELVKGIPSYSTDIEGELTTPTGAALVTTLSSGFGGMPPMKIERIGYGVGKRNYRIPNLLRVLIGDEIPKFDEDRIRLIETNIDDMNPQFYDCVMEELFKQGALDVYLTPTYMKKNRPGIILSVISPVNKVEELVNTIFRHTTTLGVRISEIEKREKLKRKVKKVSTKFGDVKVKIGFSDSGEFNAVPEYEDCKKIAQREKIPVKEVYNEILGAIQKSHRIMSK